MSDTNTEIDEDYQEQLENAGPSVSEHTPSPVIPDEVPPVTAPVAGTSFDEDGNVIEPDSPEAEEDETYEAWTVEELKDECETEGVEVTRGDGQSGDPLKEDYIKALEAAHHKE